MDVNGLIVTITGTDFGVSAELEENVIIGHTNCDIQTSSSTEIVCELDNLLMAGSW